jgi:hypothetical protein
VIFQLAPFLSTFAPPPVRPRQTSFSTVQRFDFLTFIPVSHRFGQCFVFIGCLQNCSVNNKTSDGWRTDSMAATRSACEVRIAWAVSLGITALKNGRKN